MDRNAPADLHVHSTASWCAAGEMTADAILARARALGLAAVGLADHLWLDPRCGSRPAVARLLGRPPPAPGDVTLLLGAEADCAPGLGLAGGEAVRRLDFVIAADHFAEIRAGLAPWPADAEALAARIVAGFGALLASGAPVAGHPFFLPPRVYHALPPALQAALPDVFERVERAAAPLLEEAARSGLQIELNARALGPLHRPLLLPLFRLAREAGCRFTRSSDAHRLDELERARSLDDYARTIGLLP